MTPVEFAKKDSDCRFPMIGGIAPIITALMDLENDVSKLSDFFSHLIVIRPGQ